MSASIIQYITKLITKNRFSFLIRINFIVSKILMKILLAFLISSYAHKEESLLQFGTDDHELLAFYNNVKG